MGRIDCNFFQYFFLKTIFLLTIPPPFEAKFICTLYGVLGDDFHEKISNFVTKQISFHFITFIFFYVIAAP